MQLVVGVADMKISKNPEDLIVTYSLGSCIGVAVYDPVVKVGGILHYMLPQSKIRNNINSDKPYMFADTGVPLLFKEAYKLGAQKSRMIVKIAGGSQLMDDAEIFNIGKRNYIILKKLLWKNQVLIESEHVGGALSRTMYLELSTGNIWLKVKKEKIEL
ncbi:chemotaxis protein CheD [bacterium]|nr:chemotaxis protein CheD [bacterium]